MFVSVMSCIKVLFGRWMPRYFGDPSVARFLKGESVKI